MGKPGRGLRGRRTRRVREFRPSTEVCERRDLAAAHGPGHAVAAAAAAAAAGHHAALIAHAGAAHARAEAHTLAVAEARAARAARAATTAGNSTATTAASLTAAAGVVGSVQSATPRAPVGSRPGVGPGLGKGLVRLALPYTYGDFGIITLWNNTADRVGFDASASTYQGGRPQFFVLNPGQYKSFYAPVVNSQQPAFTVDFGAAGEVVTAPVDNVVFEGPGFVPSGTAGYPYAINDGVNGYYLSYI